jgi:hypothetical protein
MNTQAPPCCRNESRNAVKMNGRVLDNIVQDPPVGPVISLRRGANQFAHVKVTQG